MTDDNARIAPPPSVDDVLSALADESRIGQVDFSSGLGAAPAPAKKAATADRPASRTDVARARREAERRAAPIVAEDPEPAPVVEPEPEPTVVVEPEQEPEPEPDVEPEPEPTLVEAEPAPAAAPQPERAPAALQPEPKPKKARRPKKVAEPVVEPAAVPVVPAPVAEPVAEPVAVPVAVPLVEVPQRAVDVARAVEEIAAEVIGRMRSAEQATLRHLEAMELEATRRYELVTAQAELDAELIRLQSRREAHAIVTAARLRSGDLDDEHADPEDEGHRLAVFSDAISRVADATDVALSRGRGNGA